MAEAIVVDTMIASAWLGTRRSQRQTRWATVLEASVWVLPFVVVAEMRDLPVQYPGQAAFLDQQITQPVIAVDQPQWDGRSVLWSGGP